MSGESSGMAVHAFTDTVKRILMLAHSEAHAIGSHATEPEHLLIALVRRVDEVHPALKELKVVSLRRVLHATSLMKPEGYPALSESTNNLLDLAYQYSGNTVIQPLHLLLALLFQRRPGVRAMLKEAGTSPDRLQLKLMGAAGDSNMDRLQPASRLILAMAEAEARNAGHEAIEPEHILVALGYQHSAPQLPPFPQITLNPDTLRASLYQVMPKTEETKNPVLSEDTKHFLQETIKVMHERNAFLVSPTHIILALLRQAKPGVMTMLFDSGVTVEIARAYGALQTADANKIERFTQRARLVLKMAQDEAEARGHRWIQPEHLLVAMALEADSEAGKLLREAGITGESLKSTLDAMTLEAGQPGSAVELSDATKQFLEISVATAREWNHTSIGTEHLLAGLMRQASPGVVAMLAKTGTMPEALIERVKSSLFGPKEQRGG